MKTLRQQYAADLVRRLARLRRGIEPAMIRAFEFPSDIRKASELLSWLDREISVGVFEVMLIGSRGEPLTSGWERKYIQAAYGKGIVSATAALRTAGVEQGIIQAVSQGSIHHDFLQLLHSRNGSAIKGAVEAMRQQMSRVATAGLAQGIGLQALARLLSQQVNKIGIVRSRTIARTEPMFVLNAAALHTYEATGMKGLNVEIPERPGSSPCSTCSPLQGKAFTLAEAKKRQPPHHPNCLPGDATVTAKGITAVSKRWYDGDLIIVRTASGKRLTTTVHHPILTDHGWIPACCLQIGNNIVCSALADRGFSQMGYDQNVPTRIHDVAESLFNSGKMTTTPVPSSTPDFHGDGINGKVCIIGTDRQLLNRPQSSFLQKIQYPHFQRRNVHVMLFMMLSPLALFLKRMFSSSHCIMSRLRLVLPLFGVPCLPSERLCLTGVPQLNPSLNQALMNSGSTDVEYLTQCFTRYASLIALNNFFSRKMSGPFIGDDNPAFLQSATHDLARDTQLAADIMNGMTGSVSFDQILDIDVQSFHGYVYNLQTVGEFYHTDGLVVHNCECVFRLSLSAERMQRRVA